MKIADRTPFRNESGAIDFIGRIRGSLKYGLAWYARLQAQDAAIAVLEKVLGDNFILLRNVTLPETEIDLPLVLIGPPGAYLINVIHERGVYRARDDEWGTIVGEKFVPAGINQLQRTIKLGRVLQVYLDRAGLKGQVIIDPILMAADPGMHVDSVRPAARIVMSDALERFAISMSQARPVLSSASIGSIAKTIIIEGARKEKESQVAPAPASVVAGPAAGGHDTSDTLFNPLPQQQDAPSFAEDGSGFSFDDAHPQTQHQVSFDGPDMDDSSLRTAVFQDDDAETLGSQDGSPTYQFPETQETVPPETAEKAAGLPSGKKKRLFGLTGLQLGILGGIFLLWVCAMLAFVAYIYISFNG